MDFNIDTIVAIISATISLFAVFLTLSANKKAKKANELAQEANDKSNIANKLSEKANSIADNANYIAKESVEQNKRLTLLSERKKFYFEIKKVLSLCSIVFDLFKNYPLTSKISKKFAIGIIELLLPDTLFKSVNDYVFNLDDSEKYAFCCEKITFYDNMSLDSEFLFGDDIGRIISAFLSSYFYSLQYLLDVIFYQNCQNRNSKDNELAQEANDILEHRQDDIFDSFNNLEKYYNLIKEENIMDKIKDIIKIDIDNKESNND